MPIGPTAKWKNDSESSTNNDPERNDGGATREKLVGHAQPRRGPPLQSLGV